MERVERRFVSCPVCGRILMKCQGNCSIEITCGKCSSDIMVTVDEEKVSVQEYRKEKDRVGQVKVSVAKGKGGGLKKPVAKVAGY